jgi:hypothetical protein
VDLELGIHHGLIVRAHLAGADPMIVGLAVALV